MATSSACPSSEGLRAGSQEGQPAAPLPRSGARPYTDRKRP
eukprot:CAMPEP_0179154022 /NCGR_PEP_ID=MMETSP0796-20121207/74933_1 /TAXON_ID=73915 /ORGANISM="Pyrodinium bahamense, Strain pbaha01" /LENGTH=40 /DNA_ID= /DNA_START= /DNA_END= /DNA_ORIENTATION=